MARGRCFSVILALSLLSNALCVPDGYRRRRDSNNNEVKDTAKDNSISPNSEPQPITSAPPAKHNDDDDDDDDFNDPPPAPSGGSNLSSLLRLAGAFLPSLSGSSADRQKQKQSLQIRKIVNQIIDYDKTHRVAQKRLDIHDNEIEIDYTDDLKPPPFQRLETEEDSDEESSESVEDDDDDQDNGAEVQSNENGSDNGNTNSKQDSNSNGSENDSENGSDYDEPEGDGQGGGILGLIAGLSGGEGDSDLGSLLAAVGGIVANLSGDGIDLNALIASGLGLFVGLLSEGEENPGAVIGSYLLTSLDTITGGGAQNNGAFFGTLVSKLVKGTSAGDPGSNSEENQMPMSDSTGFFLSLIMGLLGDMSKTSSGGSAS